MSQKPTPKKWLGDTGATVHVTEDLNYLINPSPCNNEVLVGGSETQTATHVGSTTITMNNLKIHLKRVIYVPNFGKNIISINKILDNTGEMTSDKHKTVVKIKHKILTFERMKNSTLRYLTHIDENRDEIFSNDIKKQIDINTPS